MTRIVETTIFKFDELPEATQAKVISSWRDNDTFYWGDEWRDSLDAFAERAPVRIRGWSVGYPHTFVSYEFSTSNGYAEETAAHTTST